MPSTISLSVWTEVLNLVVQHTGNHYAWGKMFVAHPALLQRVVNAPPGLFGTAFNIELLQAVVAVAARNVASTAAAAVAADEAYAAAAEAYAAAAEAYAAAVEDNQTRHSEGNTPVSGTPPHSPVSDASWDFWVGPHGGA